MRSFVVEGELISYGISSIPEFLGQAADYVDRTLKARNQPSFQVQQPTKFKLAINRKATKDLGTPATVLARADEVIE